MTTNTNTLRTQMVDGENFSVGAGAVTVFTFLWNREPRRIGAPVFPWWKITIRLHVSSAVNMTRGFDRTLEDVLNVTAADAYRQAAPRLGLPWIDDVAFTKSIEVRANFIDVVYWYPNDQE